MGKRSSVYTQMYFTIPIRKLYKKYSDKGFVRKAKKGINDKYVAKKYAKKVSISPFEILVWYNNVFSNFINYYKGSERLSDLYGFFFTLKRSAALTVSNFFRKNTAK
jgi:hypothetical protein